MGGCRASKALHSLMAVQVADGAHPTAQVDVFSFGVVLWELVTKDSARRGHMRDLRVPEEYTPPPPPLPVGLISRKPNTCYLATRAELCPRGLLEKAQEVI